MRSRHLKFHPVQMAVLALVAGAQASDGQVAGADASGQSAAAPRSIGQSAAGATQPASTVAQESTVQEEVEFNHGFGAALKAKGKPS